MRLRQILVNLLGNAIKFTSAGEIAIHVECKAQDEEGYHLEFSVTDTGIGISKEGIEKLFKAFQQVDTSTTRRYGGTGLGLVISKRLAEFMGGTIWVESDPGSGSNFSFSVTLKASEEPAPDHQLSESGVLGSHTVLIVDDNTTNRRILEILLKTWGMKPTSASGVIFALTAEALEGDKERFLGLGFDGYLSKPLQTHTLQETLRTINSSTGARKGVVGRCAITVTGVRRLPFLRRSKASAQAPG